MVSTQTNQELLNRDFVLFLKRNNKSALEQRLQSKRKENLQYKRPLEWTVAKQEPLNRALTLRLAYTCILLLRKILGRLQSFFGRQFGFPER